LTGSADSSRRAIDQFEGGRKLSEVSQDEQRRTRATDEDTNKEEREREREREMREDE
jgi:hypothetical protein